MLTQQAIEWVPLVDLPTWSGRKQPKRNNVAANEGKAKRYYNVTPFVGCVPHSLSRKGHCMTLTSCLRRSGLSDSHHGIAGGS